MLMKIDNQYKEVSLWSFLKIHVVSALIISALVYGFFFVIGLLVTIAENI